MGDEFNKFIASLTANVSSKSQSRILLARKMRERETILWKNRNPRQKIRNLVGALQRLEGIEKEVQDLTTNINTTADDGMWNGVKDCFC